MVMSEFEAIRVARTDSLTGVLTRGGFRDAGDRMLSLAERYKEPLSCILLDVDHFKSINDTHGHAVGDLALIGVVSSLRERLRSTDIVGRIGGEEFAILLPRTALSEAVSVAEQVRQAVAVHALKLPAGTISATVSLGVSSAEDHNCTLDELLHRADSVLYAAKQAGRNRTMVWRSPPKVEAMRRVLKAGQISFDAGRRSVECTVKFIGQLGARVEVINTSGIPDKFKLAIVDENFSRLCRVAGKQARSLDVIFA
jgi:diguanylate cyclase (GGDEF)-like protein